MPAEIRHFLCATGVPPVEVSSGMAIQNWRDASGTHRANRLNKIHKNPTIAGACGAAQ
jgi:hypothetical protein